MVRRLLLPCLLLLVLSLAAPAGAQDPPEPPPDPEETPVVVAQEAPVPQQATSSSTQEANAGADLASSTYGGCKSKEGTLGAYTAVFKGCVEQNASLFPGKCRTKWRVTFWLNHPTGGRTTAYGNVRWDLKYNNGHYRRGRWWDGTSYHVFSYTSARGDAIQAHTTVAYSIPGSVDRVRTYVNGSMNNLYVRMPAGQLWGPWDLNSANVVWFC
jgi:hypothetical protein